VLRVECRRCTREGRYQVRKLIAKYGPQSASPMSEYLLALLVALSVAAFASQVSARDGAGRDAAMLRCIKMGYAHYHDESQHIWRAQVYKACMVAAGYKP
jgi:hypothetical protein